MDDSLFSRLADYFAVVGINKQLKTNTPDSQLDLKVTSLTIYAGYLNTEPSMLGSSTEKWLELDGSQTLWLKIKFNEEKPALTKFGIYEIPENTDGALVVPISNGIFPVPIYKIGCSRESDQLILDKEGSTLLFKGEFNLGSYLHIEPKKRKQLVLCTKKQSNRNYRTPLNDIMILPVEKNKKDELVVTNLPDQYKFRKFRFGRQPNFRILAYRKCPNIEKLSFAPVLLSRYPKKNYPTRELQSAIAIFCFPSGITLSRTKRTQKSFSFILTQQDGQRIYVTCLIFDELLPERYLKKLPYVNDDQDQTFFVQKAICITSKYAFTEQFAEVLKELYKIHLFKNTLPIERYICNFIDEAPAPLRGESSISYSIGTKTILFRHSAEYPFVSDRSIKNLFTMLGLKTILLLFELVLLERQIFLVSRSKSLLMDVTDALTALIFPLTWTQVLIPVLPQSLKAYAEAPVPFIIGIENCDGIHEFLDNLDQNAYRVDLDTDTLVFKDELPSMPEKELTALIKKLKKFSKMYYKRDSSITNYDEAFLETYEKVQSDKILLQIRDAFFQFICSILQDCNQFCLKSHQGQHQNKGFSDYFFDYSGFLITASKKFCKGSKFMKRLTEATHFSYFIQSRFLESPKDNETLFIRPALKNKLEGKPSSHLAEFTPENIFEIPRPSDENLPEKKADCCYKYDCFPKLREEYFIEPRIATWSPDFIKQRTPTIVPKVTDDMDNNTWEKLVIQNLYEVWFIFLETKIQSSDCNYYPRIAERALSLFEEYRAQEFQMKASIVRSVVQILCCVWMEDKALRLLTRICEENPELLTNPHSLYLNAIAKAKECENSINYVESPLVSLPETESSIRKSLNSISKIPSQTSTPSEGRKSDPTHDISPILSTTSLDNFTTHKINHDELTPYSYCINIENGNLKSDDILKFWRAKKNSKELLSQQTFQKLRLIIEERKLDDVKKIQIEWKCPIDLRNEIESILKNRSETDICNDKFDQKNPELYWNLIAAFQLIKAPTIFFESTQNAINVARAIKKLEVDTSSMSKINEEQKEKTPKSKSQTLKKKFATYFIQFLQENETLKSEMKSLDQIKSGSLNSMILGNEPGTKQETDNRPSLPSIELLICEEEELKEDSMESSPSTKKQENFRQRNTPDINIKRPAALMIRKNPGLSRFGQEHQRALSQNAKSCNLEERKIESSYPLSQKELS